MTHPSNRASAPAQTSEELRNVAAAFLAEASRRESEECTGVAASWCPICGDCACPDSVPASDPDCPLHSAASIHAEKALADLGTARVSNPLQGTTW